MNNETYYDTIDSYYDDLNSIAHREYGQEYSDLPVNVQKIVENILSSRHGRKGNTNTVYRLDTGEIVGESRAREYQENYGKMMEDAWNEHVKSRKGNKNVSNIIISRLTK